MATISRSSPISPASSRGMKEASGGVKLQLSEVSNGLVTSLTEQKVLSSHKDQLQISSSCLVSSHTHTSLLINFFYMTTLVNVIKCVFRGLLN